jgi:phosphohistidine swiveling domain-containing protein
MKEIHPIVHRDFNQWSNQLVKECYEREMPPIWGMGLNEHMVHFTGKSFIWYRYKEESAKLKEFLTTLKLDHPIFSKAVQEEFKNNINKLRGGCHIDPNSIKNISEHLKKQKQHFVAMYPLYPLPIFLADFWRTEFIETHGKAAQPIIDLLMESRVYSEGAIKENDNFMRALLGPLLEKVGVPKEYVKILSVEEVEALCEGTIPSKEELDERFKGFFYRNNRIIPTTNLKIYLHENNLSLNTPEHVGNLKGIVACRGKVQGKVQIIYNSEQVKDFDADILVTPMTAPDFLPAIERAKAIITDEGGVTSHIAIVSRELNKPSIMGTKVATKVLKDGDIVEVDAENGIVRKL